MGDPLYISIAGLIGAGKTTLAQKLAAELGVPVFHEGVDSNPYLGDFYSDMGSCAFAMEMYLLEQRARQQLRIAHGDGGVQDRTIYEDHLFARLLTDDGHISERDMSTYSAVTKLVVPMLPRPHAIVFLDVTPEVAMQRIRERNRDCEKLVPMEYLQKLHARYQQLMETLAHTIPVIRVDWSQFLEPGEVASRIHKKLNEVNTIHNIKY